MSPLQKPKVWEPPWKTSSWCAVKVGALWPIKNNNPRSTIVSPKSWLPRAVEALNLENRMRPEQFNGTNNRKQNAPKLARVFVPSRRRQPHWPGQSFPKPVSRSLNQRTNRNVKVPDPKKPLPKRQRQRVKPKPKSGYGPWGCLGMRSNNSCYQITIVQFHHQNLNWLFMIYLLFFVPKKQLVIFCQW